jgi:hypothetical protein
LPQVNSGRRCIGARRLPEPGMHHLRSPDIETRYEQQQSNSFLYFAEECNCGVNVSSCFAGTFESVGEFELQNAGKAGLVVVQGKISRILGAVLISKIKSTLLSLKNNSK